MPEHRFLAFVPQAWVSDFVEGSNLDLRGTNPGHLHKLRTDQWDVRQEAAKSGGKVFSLTDTGTIGGKFPHLLLVHQSALAAPDRHLDFALSPSIRAKMWLMRRYFQAAVPSIDRFTVQTRYMQMGLAERWGIAEERIAVVPSAVPLRPQLLGAWAPDETDPPFIFYPSSAYAHKNHGVLIGALGWLSRSLPSLRCRLTISRAEAPALVEDATRSGVLHMIDWLGGQSPDEVWHLMTRAAVVVVPSKLESFGLVYWEALGIGTPLVVADRPFAREACGDAASYAAADSAEAFAGAIADLIVDGALAESRSKAAVGRYRAHAWRWPAVVQRYLSLLESL